MEGWGADWKLYHVDEEYRCYYDGETIRKVLGILRVWEKWIPSQKTVDKQVKTFGAKYQDWEFTLYLVAIDCMDGKRRLLLYTQYDKSGKAITTFEYSEIDSPWQFIAPETVGETLLKAVCPK
jgi:Surface-adhesin protein E